MAATADEPMNGATMQVPIDRADLMALVVFAEDNVRGRWDDSAYDLIDRCRAAVGWGPQGLPRCGGCRDRRWVEDENWEPTYLGPGVQSVRNFGDGLIPCGLCNLYGDAEPVPS